MQISPSPVKGGMQVQVKLVFAIIRSHMAFGSQGSGLHGSNTAWSKNTSYCL